MEQWLQLLITQLLRMPKSLAIEFKLLDSMMLIARILLSHLDTFLDGCLVASMLAWMP
jgi:hypothetical protein